MRYWLLMFRPETYQDAQRVGLIGVRREHARRFAALACGDQFVAYVSREQRLDGHGTITGPGVLDPTPVLPAWSGYVLRAPVSFVSTGYRRDGRRALWGLDECQRDLNTQPTNLLFCRGGFMEITLRDYEWLRRVLEDGDSVVNERIV